MMNGARDDPQTNSWHIDRRIPLALIYAVVGGFFLQAIGLVVWGVKLSDRVTVIENMVRDKLSVIERLPVLEAEIRVERQALTSRFDRFEIKLDRLIERERGRP